MVQLETFSASRLHKQEPLSRSSSNRIHAMHLHGGAWIARRRIVVQKSHSSLGAALHLPPKRARKTDSLGGLHGSRTPRARTTHTHTTHPPRGIRFIKSHGWLLYLTVRYNVCRVLSVCNSRAGWRDCQLLCVFKVGASSIERSVPRVYNYLGHSRVIYAPGASASNAFNYCPKG